MIKLDDFETVTEFLVRLEELLLQAWCIQSSFDKHTWDEKNPSAGQCLPTAIVVRKILGGFILFADILEQGVSVRHYWNELDNGRVIDLTWQQFSTHTDRVLGSRRYLPFGKKTRRRADILWKRLEELVDA